jgi:UDP-N-acetyl-2-amino-2-deoxyglucuronate dehydrogenase
MTEYGFGVVGAGVIGAFHAAAIALVPDARLVAVTDVDPGRAEAFAGRHGCVAEPDLDGLVGRDDVDVVAVCVPSGLHAAVGVRAARAGKHLVVEKPIDVSLDAADRLIAAAAAARVTATVISQHRFDPGLIELRRLIDAGALGRLLLGQASTKWWRSQEYYDSAGWRGTWAMDGGALMNQGIHYADLLRWCLGPVAEVSAVTVTQAHDMEAEDGAVHLGRGRHDHGHHVGGPRLPGAPGDQRDAGVGGGGGRRAGLPGGPRWGRWEGRGQWGGRGWRGRRTGRLGGGKRG